MFTGAGHDNDTASVTDYLTTFFIRHWLSRRGDWGPTLTLGETQRLEKAKTIKAIMALQGGDWAAHCAQLF